MMEFMKDWGKGPTRLIVSHKKSSQGFSSGGFSGMKMKSAPPLETRDKCGDMETTKGRLPDAGKQGQPATVPAHDLEHKRSGVRRRGRVDIVYRFTYPV